jgi:hypothetical protein|tara:strand:+ start:444 stop:656 length:213 start_codon:yes stop_codon:yes gene_type:complete
MGNQWYNINKWVRVLVTSADVDFINKHRRTKKLAKSSLAMEEQNIVDILVKKGIFGRYKQGEETYYLYNK